MVASFVVYHQNEERKIGGASNVKIPTLREQSRRVGECVPNDRSDITWRRRFSDRCRDRHCAKPTMNSQSNRPRCKFAGSLPGIVIESARSRPSWHLPVELTEFRLIYDRHRSHGLLNLDTRLLVIDVEVHVNDTSAGRRAADHSCR